LLQQVQVSQFTSSWAWTRVDFRCQACSSSNLLQIQRNQKFYKYANPIIDDIAAFRLDYCKTKALPKSAWVGGNSMAFMRIISYLYGSFLMNNELGDLEEARITVYYIKCMLNSFQALISTLMNMKEVPTTTIDNHIKLFMSSTHYLHKKHGNLDKKRMMRMGLVRKRDGRTKQRHSLA